MKLSIACTIVMCSFLSLVSFAQSKQCTYNLKGIVTDEHDGSLLSFSTIAVLETGKGTITDENGRYQLQNLCAEKYHIVVRHVGCEPDTVEVIITNKDQVQNFQLEHHAELLNEVNIVVEQKAHPHVLNEDELDENRGRLLADILENLPGVNTMKTGSNVSKPIVHGLSGNRLSIINNGVALESQSWGDEHSPEIDPFTTNNLRLVQGAEAIKYSGAIGGIIISDYPEMTQDVGVKGDVFLVANENNRMGNVAALLEGKFEKIPNFSWRVQGSAKKSGNIRTPKYYQKNTGVEEYNFSYNLKYAFANAEIHGFYSQFNSKIGIFYGAHIENLSDLNDALSRNVPRLEDQEGFSYEIRRPFQLVEHETAGINYKLRSTSLGVFDIVLSRQFNLREEYDKHLPRNATQDEKESPEFALNLTSYSGNAKWKLLAQGKRSTEIGIEGILSENTLGAARDFIPEYESYKLGMYVYNKWFYNRLTFDVAIRMDRNSLEVYKENNSRINRFGHNFNNINIGSGLDYILNRNLNFGFELSYNQRPPAINELYSEGLHHGTASLEFGNPDLISESAYELKTSIDYSIEKWSAELQVYHKQISNFITLQPSGVALSIQGAFPVFRWQQVDARMSGLDFNSSLKVLKNMDFLTSVNYLFAEDIENKTPLAFMPSNRISGEIIYHFPELGKVSNKFISLGTKKVFKQERIPEHEILMAPDGYLLFDLGAGIEIPVNKNSLNIRLKITNLTDEQYRDYLNRFRFFTDEQGRSIQIQIKCSF